jgi:predicted transcriptional regulator
MINEKEFHVLRVADLKTLVISNSLSNVLPMQSSEIDEIFQALIKKGVIVSTRKGLMLTPEGKELLKKEYETRFEKFYQDPKLLKAYQDFEILNEEFLSTMTKWQTIDIAGQSYPNEHNDLEYDSMVISQLVEIVDNLKSLLSKALNHITHLNLYTQRFEKVFKDIEMGNTSLVSDPKKDSLHNIWFEFHEDFLRVLGRGRR